MSKCRERAILPEALLVEEDGQGFLDNAFCITRVAVFSLAVTSLLLAFIPNFMIAAVKTRFEQHHNLLSLLPAEG